MKTMLTAIAFAIALPAAAQAQTGQPTASKPVQAQTQTSTMDHSKMSGMNMSNMDHSKMGQMKMDHSKMAGDGCCKQTADGKMECSMTDKAGAASAPQGESDQ